MCGKANGFANSLLQRKGRHPAPYFPILNNSNSRRPTGAHRADTMITRTLCHSFIMISFLPVKPIGQPLKIDALIKPVP